MIRYIKGIIAEKNLNGIVIENNGIGYEVNMTPDGIDRFRVGEEAMVQIFFHVREDGMQLFGFRTKDELEMFRLLLGVNGIGPKAALGVLSGITPNDLRFAVLSDDVKTLSKAPGIGKKTAQKMILELKDKINLEDAFEQKLNETQELPNSAVAGAQDSEIRQEAVEALVALGYSGTEAMRAVRMVPAEEALTVEQVLKLALRNF